jgi:hypothetical protein
MLIFIEKLSAPLNFQKNHETLLALEKYHGNRIIGKERLNDHIHIM